MATSVIYLAFEGGGRGLGFGGHNTPGVSRRDVTPQDV